VPFRGKVNEPAFVVNVVKELAALRGLDVAELGKVIAQNSVRVFRGLRA
jgi:TatD DNase family protein